MEKIETLYTLRADRDSWQRAAMVKQEWLDKIVEAIGLDKVGSLEEIVRQIEELKVAYPTPYEEPQLQQPQQNGGMEVDLIHAKDTSNYAVYECFDMDFRMQGIKARLWIPKSEIQTNVPGMFPNNIKIEVKSGASAAEVASSQEW